MKLLYFSLFIFSSFLAVISAKESAPVLLWSSTKNIPTDNGLSYYRSEQFQESLQKFAEENKPMIIAFLEHNLSLEDFSIPDKTGEFLFPELKEVTSDKKVVLLSHVDNPTKAIRFLAEIGYELVNFKKEVPSKLKSPTVLVVSLETSEDDNRDVILREHDAKIAKISEEFFKSYPNALAIYTGREGAWQNLERPRRDVKEGEEDEEPFIGIVIRNNGFALIATSLIYYDANNQAKNFTTVTDVQTTNSTEDSIAYKVSFAEGSVTFYMIEDEYQWQLINVSVDDAPQLLSPHDSIWGPREWSYFCNLDVTFKGLAELPSVVITDMQLQPDVEEDFGEPIDCVPYFTMAIWAGILITVLLLFILAWGITMLMDINNNDRFDDPKGKTITISATE